MLWRLKMLYFWEDLGAFGQDILIWCFKRFQNDRCSCSLDEVQIKPQRGVNERYFRIKKQQNFSFVCQAQPYFYRTCSHRGRAMKSRVNHCTWEKMSDILPPQRDHRKKNLSWIIRSECVLLCSAHKSVGVPTKSFIVLSMALKRNFFYGVFRVTAVAWLKTNCSRGHCS